MSKVISFNAENEQVIISSMCHSIGTRKRLANELTGDHFIGSKHQVLFKALQKMALNNDDYDEDTLNQYADGDFGGFKYLRKLLQAYDKENPNIDRHIQVLLLDAARIKSQKWELPKLEEAFDNPHINPEEVMKLLDLMKQRFSTVATGDMIKYGDRLKKEYMLDLKMRAEQGIFIGTGLEALDSYLTEGTARRKCSIIAARPSMGKTTTIANIARRQAAANHKICVVPIESGSASLLDAMISDLSGIDLFTLVRHSDKIDIVDKRKIMKALNLIVSNENMHVVDDPSLTLDRLGAMLSNGNYAVCYIDLFERLYDVVIRPDALSEKLRTVQRIAKEANVHMCLAHQIHRMNTKEKDKRKPNLRPSMEMLKNSGAYEEIADLILLLHRDKYYNANLEEDIMEIIIAKQRRGERDKTVGYEFVGSHARLGNGIKDYKPKADRDMEEF